MYALTSRQAYLLGVHSAGQRVGGHQGEREVRGVEPE